MPRRLPHALLLAAALAACSGGEPADGALLVTVDTSGRYPVVRSVGEAPAWQAESLFTVGSVSGGPDEFAMVRSVLLGRHGALYVVDEKYRAVRVFDSTGTFDHQLGREGSGPGEYRDPYSIAWLGDSLALVDPGNSRIELYDATGRGVTSWPVLRLSGGQIVRLYRTPSGFWAFGMKQVGSDLKNVFIRYMEAGPRDTLPRPDVPGQTPGARCQRPNQSFSYFAAPFGALGLVVPTPEGRTASVLTTRYRIAVLTAGGDTVRVIERTVPPVAISDSEWSAAVAELDRYRHEYRDALCEPDELTRPSSKPPVSWIFYDDVGRLWVEVVTPGGARYDVFDAEGRLIATVSGLPTSGGIDPSVAGDRIAIVGRGSDDIPVVREYRVAR